MSELTLHTSKAKSLLLLLASLLFTAAGVFLAKDGELMGNVAYAFFGLCSVAYMVQLTTGGGYLKLRDDEFEFGRAFRQHRVKWKDVENFEIWTVANLPGSPKQVGWNYKEGVEVSKFVRINKKLGIDDTLGETYGMKMEELLSLMNEFLANHRVKHSRFR